MLNIYRYRRKKLIERNKRHIGKKKGKTIYLYILKMHNQHKEEEVNQTNAYQTPIHTIVFAKFDLSHMRMKNLMKR